MSALDRSGADPLTLEIADAPMQPMHGIDRPTPLPRPDALPPTLRCGHAVVDSGAAVVRPARAVTHAVLIEPEHGGELQPLLQRRAFAMLPLANRPLLHHQLVRLAAAGIREVDLFLAHHPQQTRDYADAGRAWGLVLRCHSLGACERLWSEPGRLRRYVREASLVMALDLLPDAATLARLCQARVGGSHWTHDAHGCSLRLGRLEADSAALAEAAVAPVPALRTARDYVRANQEALLALGDTHHVERRLGPTLFAGAGVRLDETAQLPGSLLLGAGAVIGRGCVVGDGSVIGAGALLDDGVEVRDSVLLDDSHVGPHGLLVGKIVDQTCVIDCATGIALHVDDPLILGSSREHLLGARSLHRGWERLLAATSLAVLAPALAARALWRGLQRQPLFEAQTVYLAPRLGIDGRAQARPLRLHGLAGVAHPAWRQLPWLLAVARGDLALVGAALPATEAGTPADAATGARAMLTCSPPGTPPALAQHDFLREAGPSLSVRVLLRWFAALARPAPVPESAPAAIAVPELHSPFVRTAERTPSHGVLS